MPEVTPFDVSKIEEDIRSARQESHALGYHEEPEPELELTEQDIAKITTESISAQHEAAAQALTELGTELADRIKQLDALKLEAQVALKDVLDTAEFYRNAGKQSAAKIDRTLKMIADVRETCAEMRAKLEG